MLAQKICRRIKERNYRAETTGTVQSFGVLNYSGMLFNKGNTRTPFLSMISGKTKYTNSVEFILGQEYTSEYCCVCCSLIICTLNKCFFD